MAVLAKDAMSLEWISTPYGGQYRKYQGSGDALSSQPYELDFRDSEVDGTRAFAAGKPILGNWANGLAPYLMQYQGILHHLELYDYTMADSDVLPVAINLFDTYETLKQSADVDARRRSSATTCWASLASLVNTEDDAAHIILGETAADSTQGSTYMSNAYCGDWGDFIQGTAGPHGTANVIGGGGDDMYDVGNLITTSLMGGQQGECNYDPGYGCALGSLRYQTEFEEKVATNCFGLGGYYQMQQVDGMWTFFTKVVHNSPIDFRIRGNLGADGSAEVTAYTFSDRPPHVGFVKRVCGGTDPSVNHLIIVDRLCGDSCDGDDGVPSHTCGIESGGLGDCNGADSDLDDDMLSGIRSGSSILYLLYSTAGGSCMKEDDHYRIFETATLCLREADPFAGLSQTHSTTKMLVEVDVDDARHVLFGGKAPYMGWMRGFAWANGTIPVADTLAGPTEITTALQFSDQKWLQLGDSGVDIEGDWTLDLWSYIQVPDATSQQNYGVLTESAHGMAHIFASVLNSSVIELGSEGDSAVSIDQPTVGADGWVHLIVTATCVVSGCDYRYRVDDDQIGLIQVEATMCNGALCPTNFYAIGNRADGSAPFLFPLHRLRIFEGVITDQWLLDGRTERLEYMPENSRSVRISRGIDALEITWDKVGWRSTAHNHVHVRLEATGDITMQCNNVSSLWDQAVMSTARITALQGAGNWSSSTLPVAPAGAIARYRYSDPCYDLWEGIKCSLSNVSLCLSRRVWLVRLTRCC